MRTFQSFRNSLRNEELYAEVAQLLIETGLNPIEFVENFMEQQAVIETDDLTKYVLLSIYNEGPWSQGVQAAGDNSGMNRVGQGLGNVSKAAVSGLGRAWGNTKNFFSSAARDFANAYSGNQGGQPNQQAQGNDLAAVHQLLGQAGQLLQKAGVGKQYIDYLNNFQNSLNSSDPAAANKQMAPGSDMISRLNAWQAQQPAPAAPANDMISRLNARQDPHAAYQAKQDFWKNKQLAAAPAAPGPQQQAVPAQAGMPNSPTNEPASNNGIRQGSDGNYYYNDPRLPWHGQQVTSTEPTGVDKFRNYELGPRGNNYRAPPVPGSGAPDFWAPPEGQSFPYVPPSKQNIGKKIGKKA